MLKSCWVVGGGLPTALVSAPGPIGTNWLLELGGFGTKGLEPGLDNYINYIFISLDISSLFTF